MRTTPSNESTAEIRALVSTRKRIALWLTAALILLYFGYLGMIVFARSVASIELTTGVTLGLYAAAFVILTALALATWYVLWANGRYDRDVITARWGR